MLGKVSPRRDRAETESQVFWFLILVCCTHQLTQLASTVPSLCGPSPHSQEECTSIFQSHHPHTQDSTSCAARSLLHYTTVSREMKVKTHVFTLSLLNHEEKCFSTDGRELGARGGLRFKTNLMSQFCRWLRLSPSSFFVQSTPKLSFRAGLGSRQNGVDSTRYNKSSLMDRVCNIKQNDVQWSQYYCKLIDITRVKSLWHLIVIMKWPIVYGAPSGKASFSQTLPCSQTLPSQPRKIYLQFS